MRERAETLKRPWIMGSLAALAMLLAAAGTLLAHPLGTETHAGGPRAQPGIPAGLVRAIHARLGPGPIGLGRAPVVSGIEPASGGWRARAAAQSLGARITANGTVIAHLEGAAGVSLRPAVLSSGTQHSVLSARQASSEPGRLVQHLGPLTSSYAVTGGGLEQRFTIEHPVSGVPELALAFSSPARWRIIRGGSAIAPSGAGAGQLAYAGLRATDARGRALSSRFRLAAGGPQIVVDTRGAAYPVRIDPTWTTTPIPTATLTERLTDLQGMAVALSQDGTTALVGSERADYIFHASSEGSWSSSSICRPRRSPTRRWRASAAIPSSDPSCRSPQTGRPH